MQKIELGDNGELVLETTLTKGQVAKFNGLVRKLIVEDGAAYVPIDELHGVLLTRSKANGKRLVTEHADVVKAHLVRDKTRFRDKYGVDAAIEPIGLLNLLDTLAKTNPKRATDYRASQALLAYVVAQHPRLALSSAIKAKNQTSKENAIVRKLKNKHNNCQLCQQPFAGDDEKHVHHIEGRSDAPSKSSDLKNLIIIKGRIHDDYHDWVTQNKWPISRSTLRTYAKQNNYSLEAI